MVEKIRIDSIYPLGAHIKQDEKEETRNFIANIEKRIKEKLAASQPPSKISLEDLSEQDRAVAENF